MGLERLLARLSRLFVVLLALALAYVVVSIVFALAARVEFPSWPLLTLLLAGLAVTGVYAVLVIALRGRKRKLVTALSAEAKAWPEGQAARAAGLTGLKLTRVAGFRAHARTPHSVEVSWDPPLDAVDEVVVYRSTTAFATSSEPGGDQALLCRAVEVTYADADLEDERVYFYTAFARGRDGNWSSPSWAWAATPRLPLHTKVLGSLRIARVGLFDGPD
jgi:hypothetical protein